jgi:hypothetical protein
VRAGLIPTEVAEIAVGIRARPHPSYAKRVDQEVAKTLAELELKLRELERELTSIGRRQNAAAAQPSGLQPPSSASPGTPSAAGLGQGAGAPMTTRVDRGAGAPPAAGLDRNEGAPPGAGLDQDVRARPAAVSSRSMDAPSAPVSDRNIGGQAGVLVDEVVERRYTMDAQQTVYGEIPATRDAHQSIDLAELVRFKETLQRTVQGLIDEYSRLLSLRPPAGS